MATNWYIRHGEKSCGPITESELKRQLSSRDDLSGLEVRQGASAWFDAQEVHGRMSELAEQGMYVREGADCTGPFTRDAILKLHSSGELAASARLRQGKTGSWIARDPTISALKKLVHEESRATATSGTNAIAIPLPPKPPAATPIPHTSLSANDEMEGIATGRYLGAIIAGLVGLIICVVVGIVFVVIQNGARAPRPPAVDTVLAFTDDKIDTLDETTSPSSTSNTQQVPSEKPVLPRKSASATKFENTRILVTTNTGDLWLYRSAVAELDVKERLTTLVCRPDVDDASSNEKELREVMWDVDQIALVQSVPGGELLYGDARLKDRFLPTAKGGEKNAIDGAGIHIVNRTGQPICVSEKEPSIFNSIGGVRLLNGQGFQIARPEHNSAIEQTLWVNSRRGSARLTKSFTAGDSLVLDIMPIDLQSNQANEACSVLGDFSDWNPKQGTMWIGQTNHHPSLHKSGMQTLTTFMRFVPITEKVSLGIVNILWGEEELVGRFVATELDEIDPNVFDTLIGSKVSGKQFDFAFVGSEEFLSRLNLSPTVRAKLFNGSAGKALMLDSGDRPATAMFGVGDKFTTIAVFCAPALPVIETRTVSNASRREATWAFKQATVPGQVYDTHYTDKVVGVSKNWWSDSYVVDYESYSVPRNVDFDQPLLTFQGEYTNSDSVDRDVSFLVSLTANPNQLNGSPVNHFVFSRRIPARAKTRMGSSLEIKDAWRSGGVNGLDFFYKEFQDATNRNNNWGISEIQSVKVLPLDFSDDGSKMFDQDWLREANQHIPKSRWDLSHGGESIHFGNGKTVSLCDRSYKSYKVVDVSTGKVIRSITSGANDLNKSSEGSWFSLPIAMQTSTASPEIKGIKKLVLPASLSRYACSLNAAEVSGNGKHLVLCVEVKDRGFLMLTFDSNSFGQRVTNPLNAKFRFWKTADAVRSSERLRLEAYENKHFLFRRESDLTTLRVPIMSIDSEERKQAIISNAKHRRSSKQSPKKQLTFPTTAKLQLLSQLNEFVIKDGVVAMAVNDVGQIAIANGAELQQRVLWSPGKEKAVILSDPTSRVTDLAFRGQGSLVALSQDQVCVWFTKTGGVKSRITFEQDPKQSILLVDKNFVLRHRAGEAELIKIETGGVVASIVFSSTPLSVSLRHDRKQIAIAGAESTVVQDLQLQNPIDFVNVAK